MLLTVNEQAFFALTRAGLWEKDVQFSAFDHVDFSEIYNIAEKQSTLGLIAAGFEHVVGVKAPKETVLQFVGQALQLEQRNKAMNNFIASLVHTIKAADIYALLVKGQGVAQCYATPLWRACGDVDLLLDKDDYKRAKLLLTPLAKYVDKENVSNLHQALTIENWEVELHGTLRTKLGKRIDKEIDYIQTEAFGNNRKRIWHNAQTDIYLPSADDDIIFVFTHILQHYFHGGIGLRQICDWCRLLWNFHNEIDIPLLESRLKRMGLLPKWKAFASLAVNWLGMPYDAMPFYSSDKVWVTKSNKMITLILESGNFGHGRDMSFKKKYPWIISKLISFWVYFRYSIIQFSIFPVDAIKGCWTIMLSGVKAAVNK